MSDETKGQASAPNNTPEKEAPVKRLDRRLKYQGAILKIYEDTVLVNGHEAKWDFIHHDGAAAVVAVTREGKLLMVRQYRNALDRYTLEIPAGKLDYPGEPKIECASRELEEETGYRCEKLEYLLSINTTIAFCDEALDVFLARNLIPSAQHLDPEEEIFVEEWELPDLLELIYSGKMTDGKTVAAVMAYACKYGGILQA
ncbi:NUDIX hydrolase [Clostridiaceae bacterium]|nr:NUDIX hydrolase [Clostridium sp.]NBI69626.1 NUDIX hydrolase [Clostridiaceae bacterium]